MADPRGEVKVGDKGTVYRVPIRDDDLVVENFDPSAASEKKIVFKMPGADGLITRDASASEIEINGQSVWCLHYTVVAADVVPYESSSVGGFHQEKGRISLEGHLKFSADQEWTSGTVTEDFLGRPLKVVARLAA